MSDSPIKCGRDFGPWRGYVGAGIVAQEGDPSAPIEAFVENQDAYSFPQEGPGLPFLGALEEVDAPRQVRHQRASMARTRSA